MASHNSSVYLENAQLAYARGDWSLAVEAWHECISKFPDRVSAKWYVSLANAYQKLGEVDEAKVFAFKASQDWPDREDGYVCMAQLAYARGDWSLAVEAWHECISKFPDRVSAKWYVSLANAYQKLGEVDEAKVFAFKASQDWPDREDGYVCMAQLAYARGDWSLAVEAWHECISKFPDRVSAKWYVSLANAYEKLGLRKHSLKILDKAIKETSLVTSDGINQSFNLKIKKIRMLISSGNPEIAMREIETLDRSISNEPQIFLIRLKYYYATGDYQAAFDLINSYKNKDDNNFISQRSLIMKVFYEIDMSKNEVLNYIKHFKDESLWLNAMQNVYIGPTSSSIDLILMKNQDMVSKKKLPNFSKIRNDFRKFLKVREYSHFRAFLLGNFRYINFNHISRLYEISARLFPRSRIHLALKYCVSPNNSFKPKGLSAPWKNTLPIKKESILKSLEHYPYRKLLCVTVVNNEAEIFKDFLQHYSQLGVESFIVINNNSTDNILEVCQLFNKLDIKVIEAPFSFFENRHGMAWVNEVLEAGVCDWALFVDADEFLVYPNCENRSILDLIDHLEQRGENALPGIMIDMYDKKFKLKGTASDKISDHIYFYANLNFFKNLFPPFYQVSGGIRELDGVTTNLNKVPLIKASSGVRYTGNHTVTDCIFSEVTSAFLHYKIFRDHEFINNSSITNVETPRIRDRAIHCKARHLSMLNRNSNLKNNRDIEAFHLTYLDSNQLVNIGYLTTDQKWHCKKSKFHKVYFDKNIANINESFICANFYDFIKNISIDYLVTNRNTFLPILKSTLNRIGSPLLFYGLLIVIASINNRSISKKVILNRLISRIKSSTESNDKIGLECIIRKLSDIGDVKSAICLIDVLAKKTRLSVDQNILRFKLHSQMRKHSNAMNIEIKNTLIPIIRNSENAEAKLLLIRDSLLIKDWDDAIDMLDIFIANTNHKITIALVNLIMMVPIENERNELLRKSKNRMDNAIAGLASPELQAYMAILFHLKLSSELAYIYRANKVNLPKKIINFYDRFLGNDCSHPPTIWCIGLSKTGTTSLHRYAEKLGFNSAHFINPITGGILNDNDMNLFDISMDTPAAFYIRSLPKDIKRKIIFTSRNFLGWEKSFITHFSKEYFGRDFSEIRDSFYNDELHKFGDFFYRTHHELYFKYDSLSEAYESQVDLAMSLKKLSPENFLEVPLENPRKAELVSSFLGKGLPLLTYPNANVTFS